MCQYCLTSPCPSGCPNADEPKPKYICKECNDGIFTDDKYAVIDEDRYHLECLEGMEIEKLLILLDVDYFTA